MKISAITTFVCLSVLASAASAQTTPAATTAKPVTTPAATTTAPAATPATTTAKPAATPAATSTSPTKYDPVKGCWSVSVERDATYCIAGPICSGRGAQPAGWNCPKKGDVATERCLSYLASWVPASKSCVAPVDAECKVIKTGAWGCVLKGDTTSTGPTPAPTKTGGNSGAGGNGGNGGAGGNGTTPVTPGNGTTGGNSTTNSTRPAGKPDNGTIQAPTKLVNLNAAAAGGSGSAAAVGAVAAVAAVAMAAIGTVLYKKHQKKTAEVEDEEDVVDVVTP